MRLQRLVIIKVFSCSFPFSSPLARGVASLKRSVSGTGCRHNNIFSFCDIRLRVAPPRPCLPATPYSSSQRRTFAPFFIPYKRAPQQEKPPRKIGRSGSSKITSLMTPRPLYIRTRPPNHTQGKMTVQKHRTSFDYDAFAPNDEAFDDPEPNFSGSKTFYHISHF